MQLFKFNPLTDPTVLESGETINGATSIMWVERYLEPGEFEIVAPLSVGMKSFLPLGTLISHTGTLEVMIVENHEIKETNAEDPVLTITGRTFDSYLSNRIVGVDDARLGPAIGEIGLDIGSVSNQIAMLIGFYITDGIADDNLVNVVPRYEFESETVSSRTVKPGPLDVRVRELLVIDDLGIKTVRRNNFELAPGNELETWLYIYRGKDKTREVIFSWLGGDIEQAEYLYTIKNLKTSALVMGKWAQVIVDGPQTGYNRRFMLVDASDLDDKLDAIPTGTELTALLDKMRVRGNEALQSQTRIHLTQADASNVTRYRYRIDFNVGDIVRLEGNYGEITNMRVTEYTEIQDENGETGHPTLQLPGV